MTDYSRRGFRRASYKEIRISRHPTRAQASMAASSGTSRVSRSTIKQVKYTATSAVSVIVSSTIAFVLTRLRIEWLPRQLKSYTILHPISEGFTPAPGFLETTSQTFDPTNQATKHGQYLQHFPRSSWKVIGLPNAEALKT